MSTTDTIVGKHINETATCVEGHNARICAEQAHQNSTGLGDGPVLGQRHCCL